MVLFAIALSVLHTPPARRLALRKVQELIRQQGITIDSTGLDYNLFTGAATLHNVVIKSEAAPDLPPIAQIAVVNATIDIRQLLKGAYIIIDSKIQSPNLHILIDSAGRDNIPKVPASKSTAKTTLIFKHLVTTGGSFHAEDRRQHIDVTLPLWSVAIEGDAATSTHQIQFQTGARGRLGFEDRGLPVDELLLSATLRDTALDIKEVKLVSGKSTLASSGVINNFNDPRFDLRADTQLNLGSLIQFAGASRSVDGDVKVQLAAKGPLAQLALTANVSGSNLSFEGYERLALDANANYDAGQERVRINSLKLRSPIGVVQAQANVALTQKAGTSDLNANIQSLDLKSFSRTFKLPFQIASLANGNVKANWPGLAYEKANGDAAIKFTATRSSAAKNTIPVAAALTVSVRDQNTTVNIASLTSLGATANGRITLNRGKALGGALTANTGNLQMLAAGLESFLGTTVGTNVAGSASVQATLGGTLSQPQAAASLSGSNLTIGQIHDVAVTAEATYNPQQIAIQSALVRWNDESLTANGTVGLKGASPVLNVTAKSDNVSIAAILAALDRKDIPASGQASFSTVITGTVKKPQAQITVAAQNLAAYNEPLGQFSAEAQFTDSALTVTHFKLDKAPGQTLTATGSYDLNSKAYRIDADGKNIQITSTSSPIRGVLSLAAKGVGTVDDPKLSLTLQGEKLQTNDYDLGAIAANVNVIAKQANVEMTAPKFNLTATAAVGINDPYSTQFQLIAKNTDLASLPFQLQQPITGTVTATVEGKGDIRNWEKGTAKAHVNQLSLTWNGNPIRTEGPLDASLANGLLNVERATLLAANSRVSLQGTIPVESTAPAGDLRLQGIFDLAGVAKLAPPIEARGSLIVDGTFHGSLKRIDPTATIVLKDGNFLSPDLPEVSAANASIELRAGALIVNSLTAQFASAAISASGEVPLGLLPTDLPIEFPRKAGPARFTAAMKGLQLANVKGMPEGIAGTISLHADVEAPKAELAALTARLTFDEFRVNLEKIPIEQQGASTLSISNAVAKIEQFRLTGPDTTVELSGTAGLNDPRPLDLHVNGSMDAALLAAFTKTIRARGATSVELAITGTAANPQANGFAEMKQGELSLPSPRIQADNINLRVDLNGNAIRVSRLTGALNGGTVTGSGSLAYANGEPSNVDLRLQAKDVYLDFPKNLKTVSNADINLQSRADRFVLGGHVDIIEGSYTANLNLDLGLASYLNKSVELGLTEERNKLLQRLTYSLGIKTQYPLVVDNNLAKAEFNMNTRLVGTFYDPGLTGSISIEEGGKLNLNERSYLIDRGAVTFTSEQRIEPNLDILARTQAAGYDITLRLQGTTDKLETTFTSDPPLPEPDVIAVLLTGKKVEEIRGQETEIAKNQVLSYLTGRVGGSIGGSIQKATGLSQVRIEPNLIANESVPSARLSVGQNITPKLNVIYSVNLADSSDQIYLVEYDLSKRFRTRGLKQTDNSYRFDFNQLLEFGGPPPPPKTTAERERRKIGKVEFSGDLGFPEKQLAGRFKVKEGRQYDFFKVRKGLDRVEKLYTDKGLLEAKFHLNRENRGALVDLDLNIQPGPNVDFVYEGHSPTNSLRKQVRGIWQSGVFDTQRGEEAVQAITDHLVNDNYLQSKVEYKISTAEPGHKRVLFDIQPGVKFHGVKVEFKGAEGVEASELKGFVKEQKLASAIYTDPARVTDLLSRDYREKGFLEAKIGKPDYALNAATQTGSVSIPITEGPLFHVGKVEFTGNTAYDAKQLSAAIALKSQGPYRPDLRETSLANLREIYGVKGYNNTEIEYTLAPNGSAGLVDINFKIIENGQAVVKEVNISGTNATSEAFVRKQLNVKSGDFQNLQAVSRSRRNLYNTGAYSLVDIESTGRDQSSNLQLNQVPVILNVKVQEIRPFQLNYGAYFDTDRGPGAIADLANRNSLGEARVIGLRARYDSNLQEGRLYFSQPFLQNIPLRTISSVYIRREVHQDFNTDRLGLSLEQQARFKKLYTLNYGYRMERTHTYERVPDPLFDVSLRVAPLTATFSRETRDDVFDATRGMFLSNALEYAPAYLGSELKYIKYFAQFSKYFAFDQPRPIPYQKGVRKSRLVFATEARVGLARGLGGQDLIPGRSESGQIGLGERFFAGGGTTIRGFEQDGIGPRLLSGGAAGGNALFILNNEMRFPLFSIIDLVGFLDIGNVYAKVSDFRLTDVRKAGGLGLRIRTPYFLIRLDYGLKLDRRPGETLARPFFSIGQAF